MKNINLIPASERRAKKTRRHVRLWAGVCTVYGVILLLVTAFCHGALDPPGDVVRRDLDRTLHSARQSHETIQQLSRELTEVESKLAASRAVGQQPDWSKLLGLLAQKTAGEIVLRNCSIAPAGAAGSPRGRSSDERPDEERRYVVTLEGYGRSQAAVAGFVLRLERTGLFGRVQQQGARREQFLSATAVRFALTCDLTDQEGR